MSLEIERMLALSTAHLSSEDVDWLILHSGYIYPYEEGWFIPVGIDEWLDGQTSLADCLTLAKKHGCTILRLDRDAQTTDLLPKYDWE